MEVCLCASLTWFCGPLVAYFEISHWTLHISIEHISLSRTILAIACVCVCVSKDSALKRSKGLFVTYLYNTAILYWTLCIDVLHLPLGNNIGCVCSWMCVSQRMTEKDRERKKEKERETMAMFQNNRSYPCSSNNPFTYRVA